MIKINLKYNNSKVEEIKISGHALYDDYGKDIVCASVSSIAITTVNAIVRLDDSAILYQEENGLDIYILKHDSVIDILIDNMVSLLLELEKQYKKNVTINKEVCSC